MKSIILKVVFLCYLAYGHGQEANTTSPPPDTTTKPEPSSSSSSTSAAPPATIAVTAKTADKYSAVYEAHARELLNIASERMTDIYNQRRNRFHLLTVKHTEDFSGNLAATKQKIESDYHKLVYELAANLSVIPVQQLRNATLRRQVQRLSKLQLHGLNEHDYAKAHNLLHKLQGFVTTPMVCVKDCQTKPLRSLEPSILSDVEKNKMHKNELLQYWVRWRSVLESESAKSTFLEYIELWRKAADYNGHVTPSRTWYLYYDSENFQRELEDVMWEIMPLYQELHAYLRHCARLRYGDRLTHATHGAIPAHVMEQMLLQDWYQFPVFKIPYPDHHLPTVKQRLEEMLEKAMQVNKKSSDFFESLGLNTLTEKFNENFVRRVSEEVTGKRCKPEVHYFPPDVALRYCSSISFRSFLQMHSYMSELQYNIYKKDLPFPLDTEPCPGFGSALGEAAVIAAGTPRHLYRLHIVAHPSLTPQQSYNRLFRMGIHTLLAVVQYFINEKYLTDVMDRRIRPLDFNCAYWKLQHKYAGVVPPARRDENLFDPNYIFYKGLDPDKSNTVKLISEILGFQFYRSLCLKSGEYKPGNTEFPLYNCDFSESKEAGSLIKKMMQMGASKHWRDAMEVATGERRLSAKGIMEYFAPLYIWLKDENKKLGLLPGWDDDIRCGIN